MSADTASAPSFAIIQAPSILGLFPGGVETLPEALLTAGLAEHLGVIHTARVEPPPFDPVRDQATLLLNPRGMVDYSILLANAVGDGLDSGSVPIVLGGDCSILIGCALALKRRGRYGLLFLDGHADFYQPAAEPKGEAASMDLALVTGRGPALMTNLEGRRPLLRDSDIVAFGRRDGKEADAHGSQRIENTGIVLIDLASIRDLGVATAAADAVGHLASPHLGGFWIHLDADVLDDAVMPAVDYRMPGGLSWSDLVTVLRAAVASGRVVGIDVTIFNPTLDRDGAVARAFVNALSMGLRA